MALFLKRKSDGLTIQWEGFSFKTGGATSDEYELMHLPEFLRRDYEVVRKAEVSKENPTKIIVPEGGWASLTLDNFEKKMEYRFRIDGEQSMRGISRELAFLEFLESKGIKRETRLVEGLTLENFKEKMGYRFRMRREEVERGVSRPVAFELWKKSQGYTS
jgi:hypothetical protein